MSEATPRLRIAEVTLAYEPETPVLDRISMDVEPHELVAVVGESGCGKTSLMRIAAGLQRPNDGRVELDGASIIGPDPRIALVFQNYAETLLPWKTVLDNVVFGMRPDSDRIGQAHHAHELLAAVGLGGSTERFPWELSGGMQQRVALARALVRRPAALLLDEPFSAVDERRRGALQELLLQIHREHPCSIIMVSHNLDNVLELTRRVLVLSGRPSRGQEISGEVLSREGLREALASGDAT